MSTAKVKQGSLARSAGTVSLATAFSRVLGLVREQVMAYFFGAGLATDAFVTAFRIPNLLRDMFAEGA
ncbi:MAG: lipid II flippase MurJ, partial [Candidatus Zixiibacteriota bacterium]